MNVDADERQLGNGGETQHLGLERHSRTRGRGHRLLPGERRPDDRSDPRDLVFGLEHHAAELPDIPAERLHDLGRRRDRVAPEERAAGEQSPRRAGFVPIGQKLGRRARGRGGELHRGG